MKTYLISPKLTQYKANMHSHSTFSDGKLTPEQLKEAYKSRGYSVFAFSDHITVTEHNDLRDPDFLPLSSAELDVSEQGIANFNVRKSFHFNIISRNPEHFEQVKYSSKNFSIEYINSIIKDAKEKNYFVTANHPNWALFTEDEFLQIEGLNGFELYNCITANFGGALSFTPEIYLYLLRKGKRIYPIGADDNHSFCMPFEHPNNDSFGGFTYILSDKLDYDSIIDALDNGNMYCSTGPQIFEISAEDDEIFIKTSDVKQITILSENGKAFSKRAETNQSINEFSCNVSNTGKFFLVYVLDKNGKPAMTKAFYKGEDY